ncbi:hypothetical protein [Amycolatopsis vastitatis]|uniref:Uncharacterized protein n=1 Tax=Amycolatopsis vastitatis TaxID=1905142 RepID=A0A229TFK1_9PSEU|nr:hypothetical protein [Amycolatopsis vastitatis]OXM69800.1 hypothetical protein CF165_09895 [Amycolatopsis vastitatis]
MFLVRQPILGTYFTRFHTFGAPLADEHDIDGATRGVDFQSGEIQVDVASGTVSTSAQAVRDGYTTSETPAFAAIEFYAL